MKNLMWLLLASLLIFVCAQDVCASNNIENNKVETFFSTGFDVGIIVSNDILFNELNYFVFKQPEFLILTTKGKNEAVMYRNDRTVMLYTKTKNSNIKKIRTKCRNKLEVYSNLDAHTGYMWI